MKNQIHTVLGANGAIGKAVIKELDIRQLQIRKVSRKPTWVQADLLRKEDAERAIECSSYVYLCIGLPYNSKIWANNILAAAASENGCCQCNYK